MNKHGLSNIVADKTGLLANDALVVIDVILTTMRNGLCREGRIELRGLGSLEVRERAPRKGRIIAAGKMVDIPKCKTVAFIPGKPLKKLVNERL